MKWTFQRETAHYVMKRVGGWGKKSKNPYNVQCLSRSMVCTDDFAMWLRIFHSLNNDDEGWNNHHQHTQCTQYTTWIDHEKRKERETRFLKGHQGVKVNGGKILSLSIPNSQDASKGEKVQNAIIIIIIVIIISGRTLSNLLRVSWWWSSSEMI